MQRDIAFIPGLRSNSDFDMSVVSFLIPHCSIQYTTNNWPLWHRTNSDQMNELKVVNPLIQYVECTISKGQTIKCQENHQKEVILWRTLKGRKVPSSREKDTWIHIKLICKQYECKRKRNVVQTTETWAPRSWERLGQGRKITGTVWCGRQGQIHLVGGLWDSIWVLAGSFWCHWLCVLERPWLAARMMN